MVKPADLFDLSQTAHATLFDGCPYAWDALKQLEPYIRSNLRPALHNQCEGRAYIGNDVFIGEGTILEDGVMIKGPAIIGRNCQIRHNAYVREFVIIGDNCVIGNSTEIKHSILFNHAVAPHFNYVGDSILGHKAHLGAGVVLSNFKLMAGNVIVEVDGKKVDTGLRKFGAMVGDEADIGCNTVLNPGSVIGRRSVIYPNTNWRGVLPAHQIVKNRSALSIEPRTGERPSPGAASLK
jgi:NDP-sugar pyrophosphorylase family protein